MRKEVISRAKYIICFFLAFIIFTAVLYVDAISTKSGDEGLLRVLIVVQGLPFVALLFTYFFARNFERFGESLGPAVFITSGLTVITLFMPQFAESIENSTRNSILYLEALYYLIYAGLLPCGFIHHFLIRTVVHNGTMAYVIVRRVELGEINGASAATLVIVVWMFVEIVFYVHTKAQANLFMTLKMSDLQQK